MNVEILTNKNLRNLFNRFNKEFFNSRLNCSIKFEDLRDEDCDGQAEGDDEILIDAMQRFSVNNTCITLLHEMAHVELHMRNPRILGHGKLFWKEIDRLYKAGAYKGLL